MKTITGSHNGHSYEIKVEFTPPNLLISGPYYWFDGVRLDPTEAIWTEIVAREHALHPLRRDESMIIHIAKAYIDAKWGLEP
jgi:hypothetical protein